MAMWYLFNVENFLIGPNLTHNPGFTVGGVTSWYQRIFVSILKTSRNLRRVRIGFLLGILASVECIVCMLD